MTYKSFILSVIFYLDKLRTFRSEYFLKKRQQYLSVIYSCSRADSGRLTQNLNSDLKMIFRWVIFALISIRECTQTPNYGKITIKNKSSVVIRVTLSPAINWNYYEQRTNRTLLRNPDKITGGNIIM